MTVEISSPEPTVQLTLNEALDCLRNIEVAFSEGQGAYTKVLVLKLIDFARSSGISEDEIPAKWVLGK